MLRPRSLAKGLGLATVLAGLAALPFAAQAANLSVEISTAQSFVSFSARAKTVTVAHRLLYDGLNCLDGPKGKWFYPKKLNPCFGFGMGAIHDASSHEQKMMLERLATQIHAGLMSKRFATVHQDAMKVAEDLKKMERARGSRRA